MKHFLYFFCMVVLTSACLTRNKQANLNVIGGGIIPNQTYFAGIYDDDPELSFCAATFIKPRVLLTAAHCVYGKSKQLKLRIGFDRYDKDFKAIQIESVIVHPDFSGSSEDGHDIAIIMTEDYDQSLKSRVSFLNIADAPDTADSLVEVVGFSSLTSVGVLYDDFLRNVRVPIMPLQQCKDYNGDDRILDSMFCAVTELGGIDACSGDSGGPVLNVRVSDKSLLGIISYGVGCAQPGNAAIYTRVSSYVPWIEDTLKEYQVAKTSFADGELDEAYENSCYYQAYKAQNIKIDESYLGLVYQYSPATNFAVVSDTFIQSMSDVDAGCDVFLPGGLLKKALYKKGSDDQVYLTMKVGSQWYGRRVDRSLSLFGMVCQFNQSVVKIEHGSNGTKLNYEGNQYARLLEAFSDASKGLRAERCEVENYAMVFYRNPVTDDIELMQYDGEVFGEFHQKYYEISRFESFKEIGFHIRRESSERYLFVLDNLSQYELYTWQADCSFPYGLKFEDKLFESKKISDEVYRTRFNHQKTPLGRLAEGSSLELDLKLKRELRWDDKCVINGNEFMIDKVL